MRTYERNSSADLKVSAEGGGRNSPGIGAEIPLQPLVWTTMSQAAPLQDMEIHSKAGIILQPQEDPVLEQREPEGSWTLWEVCPGAGSWHSPGSLFTGVMVSRFHGRTCDPEGDPGF